MGYSGKHIRVTSSKVAFSGRGTAHVTVVGKEIDSGSNCQLKLNRNQTVERKEFMNSLTIGRIACAEIAERNCN